MMRWSWIIPIPPKSPHNKTTKRGKIKTNSRLIERKLYKYINCNEKFNFPLWSMSLSLYGIMASISSIHRRRLLAVWELGHTSLNLKNSSITAWNHAILRRRRRRLLYIDFSSQYTRIVPGICNVLYIRSNNNGNKYHLSTTTIKVQ